MSCPRNLSWWTVERTTLAVEVIGVIGVLAALGASVASVRSATDAVDAARMQLAASRYESVYERQLDLWRLAADEPELGAYYMVGAEAEPGAPRPSKDQVTETAKQAAIFSALDFYAYAWNQLAYFQADGTVPGGLLARDEDKPSDVSEVDWDGWQTWASTIRSGFIVAPDLCRALVAERASYGDEFVDAVLTVTDRCRKTEQS